MKTEQTANESLNVMRQQVLSLVCEIVAGYPNPRIRRWRDGKIPCEHNDIAHESGKNG